MYTRVHFYFLFFALLVAVVAVAFVLRIRRDKNQK